MLYTYNFIPCPSPPQISAKEPSYSISHFLVLKGNPANPPSYTVLTSVKLWLKFQKEHTFACFISSSAISIRFLRNAAILFCLKLISSVGKKEQANVRQMYKVWLKFQ